MTWRTPFFLHLRVPAAGIAAQLPSGLALERDGADAFVSVTALDTTTPVPSILSFTRLGHLFAYRQLDVRAYVSGPHGPGMFSLETRVDRLLPLAGRALGVPMRLDRKLALSADPQGVALRADGLAVKGLPAPDDPQPVEGDVERRLLDRVWSYSRLPVGALCAARVEHEPWRVRRVEIDPDLRLGLDARGLGGAKIVSAQLAESLKIGLVELKIYRGEPFKEARAAG